ncbi:endonuclease/exonuclease/phosphatase family protein, partial [Thiolapillus sp.]|uniref:endonuclease/exonuclease/phosphatase family protein n=1 Tax=Thiolapillus sp. TaxID=2017437 RepID=UPI003AF40E9A
MKNKNKRHTIFSFFRKRKYDIIGLQECHISTAKEAEQWEMQWGGKLFYSLGTNHSLGHITLVSKSCMQNTQCIYHDDRIILLETSTNNSKLLIANIYAPQSPTDKIAFFDQMHNIITKYKREEHTSILIGDFNSVLDNELDIISGEKHNKREVEAFNTLVSDLDLTDSWRTLHRDEKEYTWCRNSPFTARRLDYILVSNTLAAHLTHSEITSIPLSDHRAVETTLSFHNFKRGPSYWKFNNSLLKDIHYVETTKSLLQKHSEEQTNLDPHAKWELCKIRIREHTITYSKQKALKNRNKQKELLAQLTQIEKEIPKCKNPKILLQQKTQIKAELEIHALAMARGAQTRARARFIEEGEKNTRYFLGLEKAQVAANTITSLKTDNENAITSQADLLHEQARFYSNLYQEDKDLQNTSDTYITDFLGQDCFLPTLTEQEGNLCEGKLQE